MVREYILKKEYIYDICKSKVFVPTNDLDAYPDNKYNFVYNKIFLCESQNIKHAPLGIYPEEYPVIVKPIINLFGMGWKSKIVNNEEELDEIDYPCFWMDVFNGDHLSYDVVLVNGVIKYIVCFRGFPGKEGTFDYWETVNVSLKIDIKKWIKKYMKGYTGCLNFETIDDKIIDCHLRMGDINQLNDRELMKNIINVYSGKEWEYEKEVPKIYLIPIFIPYGKKYRLTWETLKKICKQYKGINTYQLDPKPEDSHNPNGGVRIANLNCSNLENGFKAREHILSHI